MSAPITTDERAAMRERYAADLPSAWDTSAAAHARALRDLGTSARNDVPRLLDALDTAEAERDEVQERVKVTKDEVRRVGNFLRLERVAARRSLERAERAEAEVEAEQYETYRHRIDVLNARLAALGFPRCACHPAEDDSERCLPDPARWLAQVKAEALREARDAVRASSFWADGSDNYADRVRGYLSARADRLGGDS